MTRPLCKYCQKNVCKRKTSRHGTVYYSGQCSTCRRRRKKAGEYAYTHPRFPVALLPEGPLKDARVREQYIVGSSNSYRKHLKDFCERCGFQPVDYCQLDAHHNDHNHQNNASVNILTLCANCHRLEHRETHRPISH